jgi:Lysozyme like domain
VGVLLYPPIKERRLLDRSLVFAGTVVISVIGLIFGLIPTDTTPEVVIVQPSQIQVIPARQIMAEEEIDAPESKKIPSDLTMRCPKWETKFAQHGLPVQTFSFIAWRESRCRIRAHNTTLNADGSQDLGLVQINSSWKKVTSQICNAPYGDLSVLFKVDCNLAVAKYLYDNGGLRHWRL